MSYDQYYSLNPVSKTEEAVPLMKNLSILSLFFALFSLLAGFILQYTLFNPFFTGNTDIRVIFFGTFIASLVSILINVISLVLAIKGKARNHMPVLAIAMIVLSSSSIIYSLVTVGFFLIMSPFTFPT